VAQQLVDFDGSAGTAAGRHPTDVALAAGSLAPSSYIQQHMDGAWFGGNMAPVARLYWAYFGRIPDASGLSYWTGRHRAGTSTSAISNGFAGSSEFRSTYGTLSATAFVQLVYRNVLGRAADPNGLQYWVGRLLAHTPRGSVMEGFSDSNEYTTKMTGPVDVVMMYMGLLHHAPTLVELAAGQTVSVPALIDGLRLSHAYAARVG
jgi:hypothetical protein